MLRIAPLIAFFALFSVPLPERTEAAQPERPLFGADFAAAADFDGFLGQNRRISAGRAWSNFYYGNTALKPKDHGNVYPNFYGVQVGVDLAKSHGIYSTCFFNANQSRMEVDDERSIIDNFLIGYGRFIYLSMCHFTFTGSLGYDRYNLADEGDGDGMQTNFFGEFGLDFVLGKWAIKPFCALQYDFLYRGVIGDYGDWNGHGLQCISGLRLNWKVFDLLELQTRAAWVHELLENPPPFYRARFSPVNGINTPAIMFYRGNTGRDWAWLGFGSKWECGNLYVFGDYDFLANERNITHLGSLGLCLGW
jgi:hypothetical protein